MIKVTTDCCALCQIAKVDNETSIDHLEYVIKKLKKEKENNKEVGITTGNGQTAVFTIIAPGENILEQNLIKLGFEQIHTFERRKGYNEISKNPGDLKMYIKNL